MAKINQIIDRFPEVKYQNTFDGKVINGDIKVFANKEVIETLIPQIKNNLKDYFENPDSSALIFKSDFENILEKAQSLQRQEKQKLLNEFKKPICVFIEEISGKTILFSNNSTNFRIQVKDDEIIKFLGTAYNYNPFYNLIWLTSFNKDSVSFIYIECQLGQFFTENLEIGFGEDIIRASKSKSISKIAEEFYSEFIFNSFDRDFIVVKKYSNSTDKHFTICGVNNEADIKVVEQKWQIQRIITKKKLTQNSILFKDYSIAAHPQIYFVESSKAAIAMAAIKEEDAKGSTLISLWNTYSAIELNRAKMLQESIGNLTFQKVRYLTDNVCKIKFNPLSAEIKILISEHKDDLTNNSLELSSENELNKSDKKNRFKIKAINEDYSVEVYDEHNLIPESGILSISIVGDEIVANRRQRALHVINENARYLSKYIRLAIDGRADAMSEKGRKEKALTERTRKFLKEKFGIDDLTSNQKEAVEIAINTPDIAIVQGPPGTGKSTVVAAICDRLIEIAEKSKKIYNGKLILVSAFQNDTVEHIASKIYTLGLPTIKIGKETLSNIRAEDKLIEKMKLQIDNSLQRLQTKVSTHRISKKLTDIKLIYLSEKNDQKLKQAIENIISTSDINDQLWNEWKEINGDRSFSESTNNKNIKLVKGIRAELESYNDDGFYKIQHLLKSDMPFTEEEKSFLEDCPVDNPDNTILKRLSEIQESYLERINSSSNTIVSGNNISILNWLANAIIYFKQKEETSYEDEDTFFTANLEVLRDELDGNAEYIRNTIKEYGESLAATNQVAGGREMSAYSSIDNVILEEAARSNPLDLLIPMSKATERIIMVGDQNQLPHLLEDDIADETSTKLSDKFIATDTRKKLEESLFGVIFKNLHSAIPRRTITLTEQFRMHPFIGEFISRVYYKNELKAGISNQAELKKHKLELPWAKDKIAVFCDIRKNKGLEESGKSKSRNAEAQRIVKLLDELKTDPNFQNLSIGIITFYAKQVNDIFKEACKNGYAELKPDGNYEIALHYRETSDGREKLRIGSVDSFQGKEFDIVILSTVRSNNINRNHDNFKKVFGFLTLENRLNVAFSRAQKLLIVVGDGEMFTDDFAKTYVEGLHEFYVNLSINKEYGNRIQ
jgi:superfamily I DNA and/or RNA helicase